MFQCAATLAAVYIYVAARRFVWLFFTNRENNFHPHGRAYPSAGFSVDPATPRNPRNPRTGGRTVRKRVPGTQMAPARGERDPRGRVRD
jgi:hypothetical protein